MYRKIQQIRNTGETTIDPATETTLLTLVGLFTATSPYSISDMDVSADPSYFGYVDADGNWFIKQLTESTGLVRYYAGTTGYIAAWAGKALLVYDYYYNIF
jgi:hypothetical protein